MKIDLGCISIWDWICLGIRLFNWTVSSSGIEMARIIIEGIRAR